MTACNSSNPYNAADVSWSNPTNNGGSVINDYIIQYAYDYGMPGASPWQTFNDGMSSKTALTVTGLEYGKEVFFRVAAFNASGQGEFSPISDGIYARIAIPGEGCDGAAIR